MAGHPCAADERLHGRLWRTMHKRRWSSRAHGCLRGRQRATSLRELRGIGSFRMHEGITSSAPSSMHGPARARTRSLSRSMQGVNSVGYGGHAARRPRHALRRSRHAGLRHRLPPTHAMRRRRRTPSLANRRRERPLRFSLSARKGQSFARFLLWRRGRTELALPPSRTKLEQDAIRPLAIALFRASPATR